MLTLATLGLTHQLVNASFTLSSTAMFVRWVWLNFFIDNLYKSKIFSLIKIRVDFVDTLMLAPVEGKCSQQSLSVGGTVWPLGVSQFCGRNSDQHFYIEVARAGAIIWN